MDSVGGSVLGECKAGVALVDKSNLNGGTGDFLHLCGQFIHLGARSPFKLGQTGK